MSERWNVWSLEGAWFSESSTCQGDPERRCECRCFPTWSEAITYADRMARTS